MKTTTFDFKQSAPTAANRLKVPQRQWRKWPELSRRVFNATYREIMLNRSNFGHPMQPALAFTHWKTLAWNAAWIAADNTLSALKEMSK